MKTIKINFNNCESELCEISKKYNCIKSSKIDDLTKNCRAYTLFYDSIFNSKKDTSLNIALIGSNSYLSLWKEYFKNSSIFNFESYVDLIFHKKNDMIDQIFEFDIIIYDLNSIFYEHIRFIKNINKFVKPGGIIVIENISKAINENEYFFNLKDILYIFNEYFFIEIYHQNIKNDDILENNKLFILIKQGPPIFQNRKKLTIITPCYRVENLYKLKKSINFDYLDEWIIVYDGKIIKENPYYYKNFENIKEYINNDEGISGNPQRNFALSKVKNTDSFLYFLDDDNIMHPFLYDVIKYLDINRMYTFNQYNCTKFENILLGNNINVCNIDTAMLLIPFKKCLEIRWNIYDYCADGQYIISCFEKNKNDHIYIDNIMSYYNNIENRSE